MAYDLAEADLFADPVPAGLLALNPFGRVLEHDRFTLHETAAILRYVDAAAGPVLDALEAIAAEGLHLAGGPPSLAELHLAPRIAAFASAPEGAALLAARQALVRWGERMAPRPSPIATRTGR